MRRKSLTKSNLYSHLPPQNHDDDNHFKPFGQGHSGSITVQKGEGTRNSHPKSKNKQRALRYRKQHNLSNNASDQQNKEGKQAVTITISEERDRESGSKAKVMDWPAVKPNQNLHPPKKADGHPKIISEAGGSQLWQSNAPFHYDGGDNLVLFKNLENQGAVSCSKGTKKKVKVKKVKKKAKSTRRPQEVDSLQNSHSGAPSDSSFPNNFNSRI
uniref:Uncharacterized protein n=1 Tax=Strombidium rassoulzadegani TaxID=1082188 RepID=A0A7S3CN94_9SPIT|mmetsp:Transcript_18162/g.31055  ORF Transcript_18162/g.31055 Transcript_18162/m.31055 type:complete len:214 (+) Transcript_18162:444-1085(+)